MRAFSISSAALNRCRIRSLSVAHWNSDGTCKCSTRASTQAARSSQDNARTEKNTVAKKPAATKAAPKGKGLKANIDKHNPAKSSKRGKKADDASSASTSTAADVPVNEITESEASLIHRGLTLVEADLVRFRKTAEERRMHESVHEADTQLKALRGDGISPGLIGRFAPQLDAFNRANGTAGNLDGAGEESLGGAQLALGSGTPATAESEAADAAVEQPTAQEVETQGIAE